VCSIPFTDPSSLQIFSCLDEIANNSKIHFTEEVYADYYQGVFDMMTTLKNRDPEGDMAFTNTRIEWAKRAFGGKKKG
jgi:hypothetical protein